MTPIPSYGSLSESFRLTGKEHGAVNYLRYRRRMNVAHIAELLKRSLATVHRVLTLNPYEHIDNRGQTRTQQLNTKAFYERMKPVFQVRLKMWLNGAAETLKEAMEAPVVSWDAVKGLLSESRAGSDSEEPP